MSDLPDVEALLVGVLANDTVAASVLGQAADGKANVTAGDVAGPWPACRVYVTPAGSDRLLRWDIEPEVQVELWDAPEEPDQLGPAEIRRRLYVILQLIAGLPDRDYLPGEPVVSRVTSSVPGTFLPDPTSGQPRWLGALRVVLHPPLAVLP